MPIGERAVLVMVLQAVGVILAFVAEDFAKLGQARCASDEAIPIIMRDFVPDVAEEGPERFVKCDPAAFALGIVSLGDVDGDNAPGMTGQH